LILRQDALVDSQTPKWERYSRRPGQAKRRAGTHNHRQMLLKGYNRPLAPQLNPVAMGPGFRQDDGWMDFRTTITLPAAG
jgi:hypothetical protein